MLKKISLSIDGLHCESCKTLLETEIDPLKGVNNVKVDYINGLAEIELDDEIADEKEINKKIYSLGYSVVDSKQKKTTKEKNKARSAKAWLLSFAALFLLISGYSLIKNLGGFELLSRLNEGNVSLGIIFIIGLLAGFHCVGMCGGFVIAYSSKGLNGNDAEKKSLLPHFQYNGGRIISYSVIGGVLGGVGSFFGINPAFTGTVLIIAAVFMVLMGSSFVFNLKLLEKIKLRTPKSIARFLYNDKHSKKPKGPFVIGLLNGFMPCGPLQAMQLYALTSGDALRGALSLGIYALGTAMILFIFGFTITKLNTLYVRKMIKVSGVLIIVLGIFMANRGLANFGYGFRINDTGSKNITLGESSDFQVVNMDLTYYGYSPNVLYIKKGISVRWVINVKEMTGCTNAIMIEPLGIYKDLKIGENIIEFIPPLDATEIKFSCWMRMVWGKFIVTDDTSSLPINAAKAQIDDTDLPQSSCSGSGSCGGTCGVPTCGCNRQ